MNTLSGYSKYTLSDKYVLTANGGDKYFPIDLKNLNVGNTKGWYRIAQSDVTIYNCEGTFEILGAVSGKHTTCTIIAGTSYGSVNSTHITLLHCSQYSTNAAISKVRLVYNTTYSGNRAYLEIYKEESTSTMNIKVNLVNGFGWTLVNPDTAGSIPDNYSSKELALISGGIATTGALLANAALALEHNSTNDTTVAYESLKLKLYSPIARDTSTNLAGTGGFPTSCNANGILWIGTHSGTYGGLLGVSCNKNLYYRFITNGDFSTSSWRRLIFEDETFLKYPLSANFDLNSLGDNSNKNGIIYLNTSFSLNTYLNAPFAYGSILSLNYSSSSWMLASDNHNNLLYRLRWWSAREGGNNWSSWYYILSTKYIDSTKFSAIDTDGVNAIGWDSTGTKLCYKDFKVKLLPTTENGNVPILLSSNKNDLASTVINLAYYSPSIYTNPSSGALILTNTGGLLLVASSASGNPPQIRFMRGTETDTNTDWAIAGFSDGFLIRYKYSTNSWTNVFKATTTNTYIYKPLSITGGLSLTGTLTSTVATGTAPLTIASTTKVTNLNADMLDGYHASDFFLNTDLLEGFTTENITVKATVNVERILNPEANLGGSVVAPKVIYKVSGNGTTYTTSNAIALLASIPLKAPIKEILSINTIGNVSTYTANVGDQFVKVLFPLGTTPTYTGDRVEFVFLLPAFNNS